MPSSFPLAVSHSHPRAQAGCERDRHYYVVPRCATLDDWVTTGARSPAPRGYSGNPKCVLRPVAVGDLEK
ncbi:hypothetical protein NDU88_000788 [Pleurodeles waltl]|uniref:Uncharacterized protein n=1 Tax=Pleurodeles waltl TaxID=8319 RepID=A0AAV7LZ44_PLEWA|nr:hypothetical protein NDU88_000788 [Pleurodeles waltl]